MKDNPGKSKIQGEGGYASGPAKDKSDIKKGSEQSPGRKPDEKHAPPKGELGKPIPDKLPVLGH